MRRVVPRPSNACARDSTRSNPSRWFSTREIARANAAGSWRSSPSRIRSTLMQGNHGRWDLSCRLLRAVEWDGTHWTRPHRHALHARRRGGEDVELEPAQREALTRAGEAPECLDEQPADRLRVMRGERDAEAVCQASRQGVALELQDARRGLGL